MSTIVTRAGKGSPLTHNEVDANFNNLNSDKYESGSSPSFAGTTLSSGNLTFSSTAQRITGDMSNATVANRLMFQNSVANGATTVFAIPNGTSTTSGFFANNNSSDPANGSEGVLQVSNTEVRVAASKRGTGTDLPLTFYTTGSERVRIDTSGNVGIGTASPGYKLQVNGFVGVTDGTSTIRLANSGGVGLVSTITNHPLAFQTNDVERMRIDSSGNVGIGTASPVAKLDVISGTARVYISNQSASGFITAVNTTNTAYAPLAINGSELVLKTGDATRATIDSSGNVGIGGTAEAFARVGVTGTYPTSGSGSVAYRAVGTIPSGSTSFFTGFSSFQFTQAASFTLTDFFAFSAAGASLGAGSAVTNNYCFNAGSFNTFATNNYGFYSDIASGSNRWNFYANGTADNYFAGNVGIGTTSPSSYGRLGVMTPTANNGFFGIANSVGGAGGVQEAHYYTNTKISYYDTTLTNGTPGSETAFISFGTINSGTLAERMRITSAGNVVAGASAALATTATDGFLYVPTCAGTPTGTPTAITGMAPIVVDTTNNKLYFYSTGQWRDAGP